MRPRSAPCVGAGCAKLAFHPELGLNSVALKRRLKRPNTLVNNLKINQLQQHLKPLIAQLYHAIDTIEQHYSDSQLGAGFTPWFHPQLFNVEAERPSDYVRELEQQITKLIAWQARSDSNQEALAALEVRVDDQLRALFTAVQKFKTPR